MKELHPDIIELLVIRAGEGLSDEQAKELASLLREHGLEDIDDFDLAAAAAANAIALRDARETEDAPDWLKANLQQDAMQFFERQDKVVSIRRTHRRWQTGWAVAAMLALVLVTTSIFQSGGDASVEQQRLSLLARSDTQQISWAPSEFDAYNGVTGDVVWNDADQEGYLLLAGMPVNDPGISQYQLWIVDPDRDANPVDGGVFDIPSGQGTVVIPVDAKLAVDKPAAFAITREKPGGVVVSQGPLLVVAAG